MLLYVCRCLSLHLGIHIRKDRGSLLAHMYLMCCVWSMAYGTSFCRENRQHTGMIYLMCNMCALRIQSAKGEIWRICLFACVGDCIIHGKKAEKRRWVRHILSRAQHNDTHSTHRFFYAIEMNTHAQFPPLLPTLLPSYRLLLAHRFSKIHTYNFTVKKSTRNIFTQ